MISRLRALWNSVFRGKLLDRDLDEELQAYLELSSAEKIRDGMSPEEAYRDARRDMGGVEQVIQKVRDVSAGAWLDRLVQDLRYGVRTLAKNPTFTAAFARQSSRAACNRSGDREPLRQQLRPQHNFLADV
jgi:hypothetical protein